MIFKKMFGLSENLESLYAAIITLLPIRYPTLSQNMYQFNVRKTVFINQSIDRTLKFETCRSFRKTRFPAFVISILNPDGECEFN